MASPALAAAHQREIELVADVAMEEMHELARWADVADIDAWWATAGPEAERAVTKGAGITASMASGFLATEAALAGFPELEPVLAVVDAAQVATALRVTGPVAFKKNIARSKSAAAARRVMGRQLAGSANRLTLAGSRDTLFATGAEYPEALVGYKRVAQSGACKFCKMLEGRGTVYFSAQSAGRVVGRSGKSRGSRPLGERFHDSCRCTVVDIWGDRVDLPAPPSEPARVKRPPPEPITASKPAPALGSFDAENSATDWASAVGGRPGELVDVASGPKAKSVDGAPGPGVALVDYEGRLFYAEIEPGGSASLLERFTSGFRPDPVADRAAAARRVTEMRAEVARSLPAGMRGAPTHLSVRGRSNEDAVWDRIHGLPAGSFRSNANANGRRVVHFGGQVRAGTVWHENGHVVANEVNRRLAGSSAPGVADLLGSGAKPGPGWRDAAMRDVRHEPPFPLSGFTQRDPTQKEIRPAGTGRFAGSPRPAVTDYGASAPDGVEDFAEAWRLYIEDRDHGSIGSDGRGRPVTFRDLFPNRADYFDRMARATGLDITQGS